MSDGRKFGFCNINRRWRENEKRENERTKRERKREIKKSEGEKGERENERGTGREMKREKKDR